MFTKFGASEARRTGCTELIRWDAIKLKFLIDVNRLLCGAKALVSPGRLEVMFQLHAILKDSMQTPLRSL